MKIIRRALLAASLLTGGLASLLPAQEAAPRPVDHEAVYKERVLPLLKRYCIDCHSNKEQDGDLNLERFATSGDVRHDPKPWQSLVERVSSGEMPPEDATPPTPEERRLMVEWARGLLDDEARARAGDPSKRPLRRLSNAEYNYTVRDLTGVDLQPAKEFPADGAAGEGFTNAAEALAMSPALMAKYLNAAKEISAHAVLLPDGFIFSASKTQRDWVDESVARLRAFYAPIANGGAIPATPIVAAEKAGLETVSGPFSGDGRLPLKAYLAALLKHRAALVAGSLSLEQIAAQERLSPKYLALVHQTLLADDDSLLFAPLRARWKAATENDAEAIAAEVLAQGEPLWEMVKIGSYRRGYGPRALPQEPRVTPSQSFTVRVPYKAGGQDVVLRLHSTPVVGSGGAQVIWNRPRFEGRDKPTLLLSDYADYGPRYEVDFASLFAGAGPYFTAVVELAHDEKLTTAAAAKTYSLNEEWLKRWRDVLNVKLVKAEDEAAPPGREVARLPFELLDEKQPNNDQTPTVHGWRPKGLELPVVLGNASNETLQIPGRIGGHRVSVHPMPNEFVAVAWRSPVDAKIRTTAGIAHAHPACGNGVTWRLETQTPQRSAVLAEGAVDLGAAAVAPAFDLTVSKGDEIFLVVGARANNHVCDLTEIAFTLTELNGAGRVWDLSADVADRIAQSNPLADRLGNPNVWHFGRGPASARPEPGEADALADSLLARWRTAAGDPKRQSEAVELTDQLATLLAGPRPADENHPDRVVYDEFVSLDGPLLKGFDWTTLPKAAKKPGQYGLEKSRFGKTAAGGAIDATSLASRVGETTEVRVPAELLRGRTFVVDGALEATDGVALAQLSAGTNAPATIRFNEPFVGVANGAGYQKLLKDVADYRALFPPFICYPYVLPIDEVVCLKTFHREDEPLIRLFLNDEQTREIERLWAEHRFISKFPTVENEYLPLFIGFVTQDQPKELVTYYEGFREPFAKRAVEFGGDFEAARAKQLDQLVDFAGRAYRRPLSAAAQTELRALYQSLRDKGLPHEQAFRDVLARVLVAPSFLLHIESGPAGDQPGPVDDWALATRLSYFLWSSIPDEELRTLAAAGRLHEPDVLAAQTSRMLQDPRTRALAVEFGAQWIHVRGFDEFKEKNEALFPMFDQNLKNAIYEESILFFQDLFQRDRSLSDILNADYTYLNEALAKHYSIPNVVGADWRRVDGVKQFGRGGILGLASVHSRQSGASRTSPVLRGNWVVETLLGEKLPPPPPNVPQLPEEETGNAGLTTRQLVEKHVKAAECAGCHQRIDPLGFALENYDPIGRRREVDLGGVPLDAKAKLKDGAEFEGIDGLRRYLLTKKREVIERLFCQRLLGYALGRSVELSDTVLLNEIADEATKHDGKVSLVVQLIVRSPQFRMIRGADFIENN